MFLLKKRKERQPLLLDTKTHAHQWNTIFIRTFHLCKCNQINEPHSYFNHAVERESHSSRWNSPPDFLTNPSLTLDNFRAPLKSFSVALMDAYHITYSGSVSSKYTQHQQNGKPISRILAIKKVWQEYTSSFCAFSNLLSVLCNSKKDKNSGQAMQ